MRKLGKTLICAVSTLLAMVHIAGCASSEKKNYKEMTYNSNSEYVEGVAKYDEDLFRRNDYPDTIADPSVLYVDDTSREDYGTFYLYGTIGITADSVMMYRSKDMTNWEHMGKVLNKKSILSDNVIRSGCLANNVYAPHVIEDGGKYYMFISGLATDGPREFLYLLSADDPYGPFDFVDVGGETRATTYEDKNGVGVDCDDYWAKYMYFDPAQYAKRVIELEKEIGNDNLYANYNFDGYFSNIDPYAFIDDDGTRYVYFVFRSWGYRYLAGVRCGDSFADVDYSSLSLITYGGHMDLQGKIPCSYQTNSLIDEGPNMIKHNGKYYLTYSFGSLDTTYQVGQAVSDNPLSGFRKLELSENGKLLSDDSTQFDSFTNPGGHDIIEVGGKTYIVYHRNTSMDPASSPYTRVVGADELQWVTIKDKFGNDLDVMYANGPTTNIQPAFDFASDYHNIAQQATVKATNLQSGSSASYLTDGLLSMYNIDNAEFNENYVKETVVTKKTTITLTFDDYVSIRGIMIYNSKSLSCAFANIERIEFDCKSEDGKKVTNYISDLSMDWRTNRHSTKKRSLKNAAAAIASFDEIQCKEIRITIDVPQSSWSIIGSGNLVFDSENGKTFEHDGIVGISEIVVLGK